VLDESSIQLSGQLVAHLDGTHLQDFAGLLEPAKPRTKYCADFARPRLAVEMDRFVARGDRRIHDVLPSAIPKTDRRRTHHAFNSRARKRKTRTRSFARFRVGAVAEIPDPGHLPKRRFTLAASPMLATSSGNREAPGEG